MRDDELRARLTEWAGPLRAAPPPPLAVIQRRRRRRAARQAAAAGGAVAAVTAGAIVLAGWPAGTTPRPAPPVSPYLAAPLPDPDAGPESAPYFITLDAGNRQPATVSRASGGTLGQIRAPAPGLTLAWVTAAGDDRTFAFAARDQAGQTTFWGLRLSAAGQPGRLTRLPVPPLAGGQVTGLALSADGSQLAIASGTDGGRAPQLEVASLATRTVRTWSAATGQVSMLSWAGDDELAFYWLRRDPGTGMPRPGSGVRLLDTTRDPASPLAASRLLVPDSISVHGSAGITGARITPDGRSVLLTLHPAPRHGLFRIARFSATTGQLEQVVLSSPGDSPGYCGVTWTSPSGDRILAQCGIAQTVRSDHGTTRPANQTWSIPGSTTADPTSFAW
ncbi:MAG TPA: hypothetical protein VGQ05_11065 [Streptosporangiaceae bacterium]|jgi:hypothetical protein|nr:hypothetical protein [Streptosporangiaceae bacterium]